MPTLTLPAGLIPVAGAVTSAPAFDELWYAPAQPDDSFAIVNGGLDTVNLGEALTDREIRARTQQTSAMVGRTGNLDFFRAQFNIDPNDSLEGSAFDDNNKYLPIPGAACRKHFAWAPKVVQVRWMIAAANDAVNDATRPNPFNESSQFKLFVDGAEYNATKRGVRLSAAAPSPIFYDRERRQDRHYHGHYCLTGVGSGWHDFSLRVISNARQTRLRVTSLSVLGY